MDHNPVSAVDLAADASFIAWVQQPDQANTAVWKDFLAKNPDLTNEVALARQLVEGWHVNRQAPPAGSQEAVWQHIQAELSATERPPFSLGRFMGIGSMRYAAAVAGVLLLAAAYVWVTTAQARTQFVTGKGEIRTITLPDGSSVVLAANSTLSLSGSWTPDQPRELTLQGEAFFSVTHQKNNQPFVVKTPDNLRVNVLGTTFTVQERASNTRVVLNSGQVALYRPNQTTPLLMKPGELVDVPGEARREVVRRRVLPEVYSAWKDNRFVFEDTSLGEIAAMIESETGEKIVFTTNAPKALRVTLRLPNRDLNLLLASIAEIHDLRIDRQPDQVVISVGPLLP